MNAFGQHEGNTVIYLDHDGPTREVAFAVAKSAVEAVVGVGSVSFVKGRDEPMQNRQVLLWVKASRIQLYRWETALAANVRANLAGERLPGDQVSTIAIEKHLAFVALNNLLRAIDNADGRFSLISPALRHDIRNQRDLHEHWDEQMPAFYSPANPGPLKRGGKIFAARHPGQSPFGFISSDTEVGPKLGPGLAGSDISSYLDVVQTEVLKDDPSMQTFIGPDLPSPWLGDASPNDRWWPSSDSEQQHPDSK